MASISSVASVFVILLVAYCSSVPLPTDNDYTTAFYDFATGKPMAERESMPMTFSGELNTFSTKLAPKREFGHKSDNSESREYTTVFPHARREFGDKKESDESHEYTTGLPLVERELLEKKDSSESHEYTTGLPLVERELLGKKESSESGEHTTGRTYMTGGHQKRTIIGETTFAPFEATSMISKRSDKGDHDHVEGDSDEITTERIIVTGERDVDESNTVAMEGESNDGEDKRSVGADMFDGLTTEYATTKDGHHKRTASVTVEPFYYEATSMFNERALAGESEEKTTERSFVPRTVDFEHFSTMESATDFNGRVEHKNERELVDPELTTFTPESSEHRERAVQQPSPMKLTKDAYRPVRVEKNFGKTGYSSFNEGSYDKSYPKKDNHH